MIRLNAETRAYLAAFVCCAGITILMHCPMLFKPHSEGDELVLFAAPWNVRRFAEDLRERRWPPVFVAAIGFLFAVQLVFAPKPVRYFAAVTPLMHLCWPYLLRIVSARPWLVWSTWGLAGLTILLMSRPGS